MDRQCPCGKVEQLRRGLCHADYERERRAGRIESLVSSAETRSHIVWLRVNGWRYREIARAAGIDRQLIAFMMRGRQMIQAKTARRVCGIEPLDRERHMRACWGIRSTTLVAATQARKHITLLYRAGWRCGEIARAAGVSHTVVSNIMSGKPRIAVKTAERICAVNGAHRATYIHPRFKPSYKELRADWDSRHPIRLPIPKPDEWTKAALCAQVDQEMFFPAKGGATREAKQVCQACEVRQQCLDFALEHDIDHGVFGGLSYLQRRKLRRKMRE